MARDRPGRRPCYSASDRCVAAGIRLRAGGARAPEADRRGALVCAGPADL